MAVVGRRSGAPRGCFSGLDGGLVVLPVGARAGEVDVQVPGPPHHAVVDEFRPVVEVHAQHGERDRVHGGVQGRDDVLLGVVADRAGEGPPREHIGHVHGPGELPLEHRTAVGDGVDLEEPGLGLHLVTGPADLDGAAQQGTGLRRGPAAYGAGLDRGEIAVDGRRAHGLQLGPDGRAVAGLAVELTGPLQQVQQQRHGLLEVLTALPAAGRPHPLEDLQSVVGVLAGPAPGLRPPTARRAPGRRHQAPARVVPAPARDRADLVQHPPLVLLRRLRVRPGVLPSDLGPGPHRQPASHARHGPRFSRAVPREAPGALRGHPR